MLHVYALDPALFTTWDSCRLALQLMGFQHGRAIAAYPTRKRWRNLVKAACRASEGIGDFERKRVLDKLDESMAKVVSSKDWPADWHDGMEFDRWLENAISIQDRRKPFEAILSRHNPTGHADVVCEEDIDESHEKFATAREEPVLREPEALCSHIRMLVTNSKKLRLIDPHINPTVDRWRPVIHACLELARQTVQPVPMAVEVHTFDADNTPSLPNLRESFRKHIEPMLQQSGQSVHVYRWRLNPRAAHDFHARYILTERGGYKLDKGLDAEYGMQQPINLLDDREWQRLWTGYQVGEQSFFFEAGHFVLGKRT